jgi:hypothetical protein
MIKDPYGGWMFDLDEREALTDILKAKFDSKQIDPFLELLQFICFQMKIWNEELLSYQDVKGYADPILKSIKKTTDYLSLLEKEQLAKGIPFGFPHFLGSDPHPKDRRHSRNFDSSVKTISNSAKASRISLEEIKSLIERQLEEWKSTPNRPVADSHSFVYDMARRYLQIFHEIPTAYPDGIFFKIVQKTREIVGMKFEDPRKSIEAALKKHRLNGTLEIKS